MLFFYFSTDIVKIVPNPSGQCLNIHGLVQAGSTKLLTMCSELRLLLSFSERADENQEQLKREIRNLLSMFINARVSTN